MKVILWDWDNTLVDTMEPLRQTFNETLKHYNLPPITKREMKLYMNSTGNQLLLKLFPNYNSNEVRQIYLQNYEKNTCHLKVFSGALEILKWTKKNNFINILASNKYYLILRKEAKLSALYDYFDNICGAEQFPENKPSKVFTDAALENYSNWKELFVVGDGVSDVKMARNYPNGKAILVGTNPKSEEFADYQPDFSVKKLPEVLDILNQQPS